MGEKSTKKEVKKKKAGAISAPSSSIKVAVSQPELIKKKKKPM